MQKMENTLLLGIEGSKGKAVASVLFGEPSGDLIPRNDSPVMRALQIQMSGRFILGRGAVPILRDGELIGACGTGGGTGEEDEDCARVGVAAIS